jgi:hypothetical protein
MKNVPVNKYEKEVDIVMGALTILCRAHNVRKLNEAGWSVFIGLILSLAVVVFNTVFTSNLVLRPQYRLHRCEIGQHIPDWVITKGGKILLVVEAKAHDIKEGVAQNVEQLYAAYKEACQPGINGHKTMYGLVVTASEWAFIKASFEGDEFKITRSKASPWELPLNKFDSAKSSLKSRLQKLIEQLVRYLHDAESQ